VSLRRFYHLSPVHRPRGLRYNALVDDGFCVRRDIGAARICGCRKRRWPTRDALPLRVAGRITPTDLIFDF
jgi:hypothetical protein